MGLLFSSTGCSAGVALDHALGGEKSLDLVSEVENITVLLGDVRWKARERKWELPAATLDVWHRNRGIGDGDGRRWSSCLRHSSARRISVGRVRSGGEGGERRGDLAADSAGVTAGLGAYSAF